MLGLILGLADRALNKNSSLGPQEALHGHRVSSLTVSKPPLSWAIYEQVHDPYKFAFFYDPNLKTTCLEQAPEPGVSSKLKAPHNRWQKYFLSCACSKVLVVSTFNPRTDLPGTAWKSAVIN